jgi:hypothetical protein
LQQKSYRRSASMEIQVQCQTCSPAGRLIGRENFYIVFQRHMLCWRENLSAHVTCVQRERASAHERFLPQRCNSRSS